MSYCIHKDFLYPFESIWSILHKFAYWNQSSASYLYDQFKLKVIGGHSRPASGRNILFKALLDHDTFSFKTGISKNYLDRGLLETYLDVADQKFFCHETLRYCKDCLKIGYHSPFHQLLLIDKCPIHKIQLTSFCPDCGQSIDVKYKVANIQNPYSCMGCNFKFYDFYIKPSSAFKKNAQESFGYMASLLMSRKRQLAECNSKELALNGHKASDSCFRNVRYLDAWEALYLSGKSGEGGPQDVKLSIKEHTISESFSAEDEYLSFIKEYIIPNICEHIRCVDIILKKGWWFCAGRASVKGTICLYAHAYIMWRMFWEGKDDAYGLVVLPENSKNKPLLIHYNQPIKLNLWQSAEHFRFLLRRSFSNAMSLAQDAFQSGWASFPSRLLLDNEFYWEAAEFFSSGRSTFMASSHISIRTPANSNGALHLKDLESSLREIEAFIAGSARHFIPRNE